eukprot:COSAG01_NODE_1069_length_11875_cov_244.112716_7_plen_189_part_00
MHGLGLLLIVSHLAPGPAGWLGLAAAARTDPAGHSITAHSTAQHSRDPSQPIQRFRTSHRNVGVKISPVPAPYFTKNGCAPSVTSWGDYLARLFHNKSQSPLSETPPYTEETPPHEGAPGGPHWRVQCWPVCCPSGDSLWTEPILRLKTADWGLVTAVSLQCLRFMADYWGAMGVGRRGRAAGEFWAK